MADGAGEHLLPLYSTSADRTAFNDHDIDGSFSQLSIDDSDGDAAYRSDSAWMRLRSLFSHPKTRLTQALRDGADSSMPRLRSNEGKGMRWTWLRRCITLGLGLLIILYLNLFLTIINSRSNTRPVGHFSLLLYVSGFLEFLFRVLSIG